MLTVLLALLATMTNAASSILQRVANRRALSSGVRGLRAVVALVRQRAFLMAIGTILLGAALQAAALRAGEVSLVQPLMALELPITLLVAARLFGRSFRPREATAVGAMTAGMVLFLFALRPSPGHPSDVSASDWWLATGVTGGVVLALALLGRASRPARRAALFGIGSGISFALTAVFMSAALADGLSWSIVSRWEPYLMAVTGLVALYLLQRGLQCGTLVAVQPGVTLADPVAAVVLGVVLFSERVRTGGWLVLELAGALAVGWGTLVLSRSPLAVEPAQMETGHAETVTVEPGTD